MVIAAAAARIGAIPALCSATVRPALLQRMMARLEPAVLVASSTLLADAAGQGIELVPPSVPTIVVGGETGGAGPAGDRPRAALGVRVVARPGGRTVTVVNLHGLRDPAGKHDTPARRGQAARLAELVQRLRRPGDLVVVCGDLNLLPDSETFDVLAGVGLVDLVGTADTRTSRYAKPSRHASYMLVSDPGAVKHFDAPAAPEVSDHRPLVLDV